MAAPQRPPRAPTQLTRHTVNGFRYQVAMITRGREVFVQVVEWLYQGGPCVKSHFLSLGNARTDYKRKFNSEQRNLLENGAPFKQYDISLLYIILQLMCGLAGSNDPAWTSPPAGQPLEHLLYKVKQKRNNIAHTNDVQQMSDQRLTKELRKLGCLFSRILRLAGNRRGIRPHVFRDEIWEIKQDFRDLLRKVREPLQATDLNKLPQLQQEIRTFQDILRQNVEQESRRELFDFYPQLWDVTLAQWLYPDLKIQPSLNFTNLVIVEDTSTLSPSQEQKYQPCNISHENLLQVKQRNGRLPEVIIISGEGGIGKTTLLKHMLEMWVRDPLQIEGLQDVSLLLYLQLRGCTISSWNDLLKHLLHNTFQGSGLTTDIFVDLFQTMQIVILLDGYDEVSKKAKKLITDLLNIRGNVRMVITTRPGCAKKITHIMRCKTNVMNVEIKGIRREDRPYFIGNSLGAFVQCPVRKTNLKDKIVTILENMDFEKDGFDVPLTLILLIIREVVAPDQTSRDVFEDLTRLMIGKAEERLIVKGIDNVNDKVKEYHEFQKKVALRGLKRQEHDLWSQTVDDLKEKCSILNLPYKEMLSGFLVSKKSREGLLIISSWSFPHNRFQEHWAAGYVVTQLLRMSRSLPDLTGLLDSPCLPDLNNKAYLGHFSHINNIQLDFPENPILEIYSEDANEARQLAYSATTKPKSDVLMEVLADMTRTLSLSQQNFLDKVATAIISLVLYGNNNYIETANNCQRYYQMVMASGQHAGIVKESARVLSEVERLDVKETSLHGLLPILDHLKTRCVRVHALRDTPKLPSSKVLSAMRDLARKDVEIELKCLLKQSAEFSELCLEAATDPGSRSRLTRFEGFLSEKGMQLLPESLEELITRSDAESVRALQARLPYLPNLKTLDFGGRLTAAEMPLLPTMLEELRVTTDGEGLKALARRLPRLKKLRFLCFEGRLTEAEMPFLPSGVRMAWVETDGQGLRALARRLPQLKLLYDLDIRLLECPSASSLSPLPYEGSNLTLDLQGLSPLPRPWVCDAVCALCSARRRSTRLLLPPACDDALVESIKQELEGRGARFPPLAKGIKFHFEDEAEAQQPLELPPARAPPLPRRWLYWALVVGVVLVAWLIAVPFP
ncbi:uncharacterized protein LOC134775901 [Penaeus indicus]|uniref:uncharacterized protein LOC134775901 n=2 Tax=Penaeus indicus TaxID=29960 RepID=UPI00300CCF6A